MWDAKWLWFLIGVAFAIFLLPMVQSFFASRKDAG